MYNTTAELFKGICDAVREKDSTTALISHQDIPARIAAISGGGGDRYYIYKSGEEMSGHSLTIYQKGSSSKKTEGWIFLNYLFMQTLASSLIHKADHNKIGLAFLADATKIVNPTKFTVFSIRDTPEAELSGNDWAPISTGTAYFEQDILRYPDTKNLMSGIVYFDIPTDVEEFYIVISTVNIDFYIEEIWLE